MPINPEAATSALSWLPQWLPSSVWEFFDKAGPVANFLAIATPLWSALIIAIAALWSRRLRKSDSALIGLLKMQKEKLDADLQQQVQETAMAKRLLSEELSLTAASTLSKVRKELRDGNRELARRAFVNWAEREGASIAELLFEQSKWALRRAAGETRAAGLSAAQAYSAGAVCLDPSHVDTEGLFHDLTTLARAEGHHLPPFNVALELIQYYWSGKSWKAEEVTLAVRSVQEARNLNSLGLFSAALAMLDNAKNVLEFNVGELATQTLECMSLRAYVAGNIGRYEEALKTIQETIARRLASKEFGPNHIATLLDRNLLVSFLGKLGKYEEALSQCIDVVQRQSAHADLGEQHPHTLSTLNYQASILRDIGQFKEALAIIEDIAEVQLINAGPDHHETLATRNAQAVILMELKLYDQARVILQDVVRRLTHKEGKGPDHHDTLTCRTQLSRVLQYLERDSEALAEINDVVQRQLLNSEAGPDHPDTLSSQHQQALILHSLDRIAEAEPIVKNVVDRKEALQIGDLDTISTLASRYLHALILRDLGRNEEGLAVIEKAIKRAAGNPAIGLNHPYAARVLELRATIKGAPPSGFAAASH